MCGLSTLLVPNISPCRFPVHDYQKVENHCFIRYHNQLLLVLTVCDFLDNHGHSSFTLPSEQYDTHTIVKKSTESDLPPNYLLYVKPWYVGIVKLCSLSLSSLTTTSY